MAWVATITNAGMTMLNQVAGGALLNITRTGTGSSVSGTPQSATAVPGVVSDAVANTTCQAESTGVRFISKVFSSPTAYKMKSIGVFASVNSGTEALFLLLQNSDGVDIPTSASFPDFSFNLALFLQTDRASSFTATVDPDAMVTQAEFSAAMTLIDAHFEQVDEAMSHVLPDVTAADNGKFLVVENGEWTAVTITGAGGGSY